MLAFCAGDDSAFDPLFEHWGGPLFHYLDRMLRDAGVAEELVQETFLRVFSARDRYRPEARFSTWLYRIATNLALNELRRPRRSRPHASSDPAPDSRSAPLQLVSDAPDADRQLDVRRRADRVEIALSQLPERQGMALWLSAVEGMSYAEVASVLETTEKSVKALVHRARVALADDLAEHEGSAHRKGPVASEMNERENGRNGTSNGSNR
jgi:RNA polymerase sigma-70 factor (ECF subfamily)